MSEDEKTGFAAIDAKANEPAPAPEDNNEHNTQAKNEGTVIPDGLDHADPMVPENLKTTSAHRNAEANANTITEVKAGHDAALDELRDGMASLRHDMGSEILMLKNQFADLAGTAQKVNESADPGDNSISLAIHHRIEQIERAVGIRHEAPADEATS